MAGLTVAAIASTAVVPNAAPAAVSMTTLSVAGRSSATPSVAAEGAFVAVAWGAAAGEKRSDVFVATSRDGGATFGAPVQVNTEAGEARLGGELPPRVSLVRQESGAGVPEVVVLWTARSTPLPAAATPSTGSASSAGANAAPPAMVTTIKLARSRDGGRHFDAPVALQANGAAGDRGWPALTVDSHGRAHAIWLDHRGLAEMRKASASASTATASTAAGAHVHHQPASASATAPAPATAANHASMARDMATHDGVAMAQRSGLYYAALDVAPGSSIPSNSSPSSSSATSASASASAAAAAVDAVAERELTAGVCYCCKTALVVRPDGAILAAWRHVYPGNFRDIAFTMSTDGGRTFATPSRVSEDVWEINGCPDDGPAMVADASGTVHIVWPTVINAASDEPEGALFYASTRDGRTFTKRQRIPTLGSLRPTHPVIAIDPTGHIVVGWDEMLKDQRLAAVRTITPAADAGGAATFGPTITLGNPTAAQYPTLATTSDRLIAVWTSGAPGASTIAVQRLTLSTPSPSAP
jgi:hypothetical protein